MMFRTHWIRKLVGRPNSLGSRHRQTAKTRKPVRLGLETLEDRVVPCDSTSLVPGDVHVHFFDHDHSPTCVLPVTVKDNDGGFAHSGKVTCSLVSGDQTIVLGSANVGNNGVANCQLNLGSLWSHLQTGSFKLEESFEGDSDYYSCSGSGTLTITPAATSIVPVNVTINATTTTTPSFSVAVAVNSPTATVNGGTVTLDLISGNTTIPLGTATVGSNGIATITVTDQTTLNEISALPPGSYELVENYSGSTPFVGSSTTSTFTIMPITPIPTTITVPNVNVTINENSSPVNINVTVNSPSGPVTSGTVTIDLVNGDEILPLGTATLGANGTYTLTLTGLPTTILSSLPPGTYQLVVNFVSSPGSPNGSSSAPAGTLTIPPSSVLPSLGVSTPSSGGGSGGTSPTTPASGLSPIQAALELALEAAMIGNMSNPGSVGELEAFANVFLGHAIPTSLPQLMSDISSLVPQAGPMFGPALGFASWLDYDLPIENPTT
jgi:hypothetical protein